jgi:PAS domain S-box-containing protein
MHTGRGLTGVRTLRVYVAAVTAMAATLAIAVSLTVHVPHQPGPVTVALMCGLLWLTEFLQVRQYHYRGHGISHNLIEGVLAPAIYACSGSQVVLICLIGLVAAEALRRAGPMKTVFNVAQWLLGAVSGLLVFHAVAPSDASAARAIAGVALALAAMSLVNQLLLAGVIALAVRASGEQQTRADRRSGLYGRLISNGASLITGVTLVAAYRWSSWLIVLGAVLVIGLDAAGRAHANVRADGHRLEGLHRATHALATSLDVAQALPTFLAESRLGFEVRNAELVLFGSAGATVHRSQDSLAGGYAVADEAHELAQLLSRCLLEPCHFSTETGPSAEVCFALARTGHSRALGVPLRSGDATIGMLLLYDRLGVEGFEAGEVVVAAALARELVGFFERVDLMRAIDEERRKLTDILESTSDGIFTVDSDGIVTSWNNGLADITGYSAAEMVNTRHVGLLRARDGSGRDILIERWQQAPDGAGLPQELQVVTSSGQAVWLSCSYSRIPAAEGRREVLVVVARNITQARELERLKDDFVAVVSHELRTPLVPIKGWAQTLINRGDRLTDDQRRTAVQSILAQAQKLESLVLNILEASRIESGRIEGDGLADVAAIAMRIVEDTLSARPDRTVRVRPPAVPCQVRGSSVWVERAVANLVANAVKYSPDDEAVDVAITVEGDEVLVSVTDRGPGIAVESQERIFERFERLEETRTQTGTGLGLYITRRLARAMGGDVSVSSFPGAGSTFVLRLPVAPVKRLPEQRITDDANVVNLR